MGRQIRSRRHPNAKALTGKKFNRLRVLWLTSKRARDGSCVWFCRCDCGNFRKVSSASLLSGNTQSCGCLQKEWLSGANIKHGMWGTHTYHCWQGMIQRVTNPNNPSYKNYGGRGIGIYPPWMVFENFYRDVGDIPEDKSLDRYPDMNGGYEPGNIRLATPKEQRANSRPISCGPCKQRWFIGVNPETDEQIKSNNQNEFARQFGLRSVCISNCLLGKQKIHRDWTFRYIPKQVYKLKRSVPHELHT